MLYGEDLKYQKHPCVAFLECFPAGGYPIQSDPGPRDLYRGDHGANRGQRHISA